MQRDVRRPVPEARFQLRFGLGGTSGELQLPGRDALQPGVSRLGGQEFEFGQRCAIFPLLFSHSARCSRSGRESGR